MKIWTTLVATVAIATTTLADSPKVTTPKDMLSDGHSGLRLHTLAMFSQGKAGEINEDLLPALAACATDEAAPVRSITARVLGDYFIKDAEKPNPEAIATLKTLAMDNAPEVRFNALYYGLTRVNEKSPELIVLLVDAAAVNRDHPLYDRLVESLSEQKSEAKKALDEKLKNNAGIAYFEIFRDITGENPQGAERYLDKPSSKPRLYVLKPANADINAAKAEFEKLLPALGIESYAIETSGFGGEDTLFLTTYITRDNQSIEARFTKNDAFRITQDFWVTPQVELELEMIRAREKKQK